MKRVRKSSAGDVRRIRAAGGKERVQTGQAKQIAFHLFVNSKI